MAAVCTASLSETLSHVCVAGVEHAEEDKVLTAYSQPNDPDLPQQWALYKLGLFTDSLPFNGQSDMGAWNR